jgi:serine/threonine-protein kinase
MITLLGVASITSLLIFLFSNAIMPIFYDALAVSPSETLINYKSSNLGISIDYPSNWAVEEQSFGSVNTVIFFPQELFQESAQQQLQQSPQQQELPVDNIRATNLNVATWDLSSNITLANFTELSIKQLEKLSGFVIYEQNSSAILSKKEAHKIVFSNNQYGAVLKQLQIWTLYDTKAYVITYASDESQYDEFLPTVDKMINSFSISNIPSTP